MLQVTEENHDHVVALARGHDLQRLSRNCRSHRRRVARQLKKQRVRSGPI